MRSIAALQLFSISTCTDASACKLELCSPPHHPAACPHNTPQVQRKIRLLEDRLQQASVRYNEMLTRNRGQRARIDGLRRERLLFEELHAKLARGLERKKAEMVEAIARIAQLHEDREKVGWGHGESCSGLA